MSDEAWSMLVDRLRDRVPDFVSRFLAEMGTRALYDPEHVPAEDLESSAEAAMLMLIERLRGQDAPSPGFAETLGRRRARQGVPLERLIEAIRLDLRIIWQMLLELAQPDATEVLVRNVERLMAVVDGYVGDVQEAFLRELAILQRDSRLATEQHLSKLFNARGLEAPLLESIAAGIGVSADSSFEVIMLPSATVPGNAVPTGAAPNNAAEHRGREVDPWLARRNVFAYMFRGWLLLFRARTAAGSSWPQEFARLPAVYIAEVEGLHRVPAVVRAGVELQALAPALNRLAHLEEFWALGAVGHLETIFPDRMGAVLDALTDIPEEDRERVLGTIRAFLGSGSVKATAAAMACHRNTVINRFKLFQSYTGLDVTVPAQASLAYLLLARIADDAESWRAPVPS